MAGNRESQQRRCCVYVGNIPYDATEKRLIEICEEIGPVVHFRLVIDRETGKPKGFGFCEYRDEETAQSARRNLQGYEINGRRLRVDFNDRSGQGRGLHQQPMGDSVAMAAATVMSGALGSAQTPCLLGADPLTLHLAKLSRAQLTEVVCATKAMASQDKEQARQLLLANPTLPKALFQAQIMLGMVSPQMLQQMPDLKGRKRVASSETTDQLERGRPSKLVKLNGGQAIPSDNPTKIQLPTDVDSTYLLQQVMSLTPEQLSSLPPDQQHQVIQLQQQMLVRFPPPHNTTHDFMPAQRGQRAIFC